MPSIGMPSPSLGGDMPVGGASHIPVGSSGSGNLTAASVKYANQQDEDWKSYRFMKWWEDVQANPNLTKQDVLENAAIANLGPDNARVKNILELVTERDRIKQQKQLGETVSEESRIGTAPSLRSMSAETVGMEKLLGGGVGAPVAQPSNTPTGTINLPGGERVRSSDEVGQLYGVQPPTPQTQQIISPRPAPPMREETRGEENYYMGGISGNLNVAGAPRGSTEYEQQMGTKPTGGVGAPGIPMVQEVAQQKMAPTITPWEGQPSPVGTTQVASAAQKLGMSKEQMAATPEYTGAEQRQKDWEQQQKTERARMREETYRMIQLSRERNDSWRNAISDKAATLNGLDKQYDDDSAIIQKLQNQLMLAEYSPDLYPNFDSQAVNDEIRAAELRRKGTQARREELLKVIIPGGKGKPKAGGASGEMEKIAPPRKGRFVDVNGVRTWVNQ